MRRLVVSCDPVRDFSLSKSLSSCPLGMLSDEDDRSCAPFVIKVPCDASSEGGEENTASQTGFAAVFHSFTVESELQVATGAAM